MRNCKLCKKEIDGRWGKEYCGTRKDRKSCTSIMQVKASLKSYYKRKKLTGKGHTYNPITNKKANLKKNFRLTMDAYEFLIKDQDNKCLICRKDGKLVVDHDHKTGKVRGLLCHKCNSSIGFMGDSVELVKRSLLYLQGNYKELKLVHVEK